jgi:fructokinase
MILVAGEALIDLVADSVDGAYHAMVGGSPANVAVGLSRLDVPVGLVARLSKDAFGQRIRTYLTVNGVNLDRTVEAAEPTSLAVATVDADGRASYAFYLTGTADWQWQASELPPTDGTIEAVHTGSLALAIPPGSVALEAFLADAAVTVSLDLNLRPTILDDRDAEWERVRRQVRYADIVKASEEDLAWLYPDRPIAEVAAGWLAAGVACAVVTLGAEGAYLLAPDGVAYRQTARPVTVVDTVGAGDAFTAAFLAALHNLGALGDDPRRRLAAVTPQQWVAVLDHAGAVAAFTCGRRGADPPTLAELA